MELPTDDILTKRDVGQKQIPGKYQSNLQKQTKERKSTEELRKKQLPLPFPLLQLRIKSTIRCCGFFSLMSQHIISSLKTCLYLQLYIHQLTTRSLSSRCSQLLFCLFNPKLHLVTSCLLLKHSHYCYFLHTLLIIFTI